MGNLKRTILIDLDGVLNTYKGNFIETFIPPIKNGADEFLKELSKKYKIKIFTTRDKLLTSKWISQNCISKYITGITNIKEPAYLYIDDRCIQFRGDYEQLRQQINNFDVWYN